MLTRLLSSLLCTLFLRSFQNAGESICRDASFGWSDDSVLGVVSTTDSSSLHGDNAGTGGLFGGRLLLRLIVPLDFTMPLVVGDHLNLCVALDCLLDGGGRGLVGTGCARVGDRAADLVEEAEDVAHAVLHLWVTQAVACHGHELLWPQIDKI